MGVKSNEKFDTRGIILRLMSAVYRNTNEEIKTMGNFPMFQDIKEPQFPIVAFSS